MLKDMVLESTQQQNLYRGPASSVEANKRNATIIRDISRLYALLNKNENSIEENMDIVLRENFFLESRLLQLQQELVRLESLVENMEEPDATGSTSNVFLQNFYLTDAIENGAEGKACNLDRVHGVVTPQATDSLSRFGYVTDTGYVFLPKGLNVFVKEGNDTHRDEYGQPILSDINDGKTNAIMDRNKNTFWIRTAKFKTSQAVTEVFGEVHIQIPTEGFQNLHTNTLIVHPYPEGSMRIRDIQYRGYGDQWSRLDTYPMDGETPKVIENARKLIFQFPNTEMTEIRIMYSQPYWIENGEESHFTYGFQDVALEYRTYTENACEFITKIDISDKNARFVNVSEPTVMPATGGPQDLSGLVEFSLYYDRDLTTPFDFGNTILSELSTIYIKTTLRKQGGLIPMIKEMRVPYQFKPLS